MFFGQDITVLNTHTVSAKNEVTIPIAHGIITWISVFFPFGCNGLVHAAIYHHEHQIAPSTEGLSITGNGFPVAWAEYYESYQPPYELKVKLWGVGLAYNHVVTVQVAILPRRAIVALAIADALRSVFGLLSPKRLFTRRGS